MLIAYTRSSNIFDDSRATKEITALLEQGYSVAVYGWNRDGESLDRCRALFEDYHNTISFSFYDGDIGTGIAGKIIARYIWSKWLKSELLNNKDIDIIHACDYDTGAIVRKVARLKKVEYIYDIYDYYVDAHPVPEIIKPYVEKRETKVINDAATTIICTEERIEQIANAAPKRLVVIHNSPDVSAMSDTEEIYDYAYCGSLFGGRLIEEILSGYPSNDELRFVFAGNGIFAGEVAELNKHYNNFSYLGAITYSEVLQIEAKSKVISAIYDPAKRNHRLCAPNKFYEALALGKPVIVCSGTGIDKVVQTNNIGIVISYDSDEFYGAVKYLKDNDELRREMGKRARRIYDDKYRWSLMKEKLVDVYEKLV